MARPCLAPDFLEFCFAIVGSGNISRIYLQALDRLPDAMCSAIVSRAGCRPEGASATLPVFPTIGEVDAPFDAVILCTPNGTHSELAAEASALGKHVLTE